MCLHLVYVCHCLRNFFPPTSYLPALTLFGLSALQTLIPLSKSTTVPRRNPWKRTQLLDPIPGPRFGLQDSIPSQICPSPGQICPPVIYKREFEFDPEFGWVTILNREEDAGIEEGQGYGFSASQFKEVFCRFSRKQTLLRFPPPPQSVTKIETKRPSKVHTMQFCLRVVMKWINNH